MGQFFPLPEKKTGVVGELTAAWPRLPLLKGQFFIY